MDEISDREKPSKGEIQFYGLVSIGRNGGIIRGSENYRAGMQKNSILFHLGDPFAVEKLCADRARC